MMPNRKCAYCGQDMAKVPYPWYLSDDNTYCSRGCMEMSGAVRLTLNAPERSTSGKPQFQDPYCGMGLADIVREKKLPPYDPSAKQKPSRGQTSPDPSWPAHKSLIVLRPSVAWFAAQMEMKLRKYDDEKDGWEHCTFNYLFSALKEEIAELRDAWGPFGLCEDDTLSDLKDKVVEEAADIANYAMMIADTAARWAARQEEYWQHYESTP